MINNTFFYARKNSLFSSKFTYINNIRLFSITPVLLVDSDDLMSRIDQLINKNRDLFEKTKNDTMSESRKTMDQDLVKSDKAMQEHIKNLSASLSDQDKKKWYDLLDQNEKLINLYVKKISDLDIKDPSYEENAHKLFNLAKKARNTSFDQLESLCSNAVKSDPDYINASWIEKQFFNAARTKALKEREETLKADQDLYLKEQEFLKKKSLESKDSSSLIDDYANPNLEQASFMDPED